MFPPVEIMDTTLRDGEQTSGVSFNAREKLSIARLLLEELHVSRIEIASARVSQGEQQAVRAIAEWAAAKGYADRVEALGFIEKADSRNDLKAVWAVVTKDGERELGRCTTALVEYSQEYWSLIGPQTTQIYLSSGAKLIEHSNYPIQAALELPGQAFYPFVTRIYLLSAVSWFKSTYNLSLLDARILMLLLERGTVLTCAEISHLLKVSNSAVSNAVRSLSRVKHYVEREKVAGSGKIKVQLTEEGVSTAQEIRERFITRYMKQFDVTREEFEEVLKAVHPRHRKSYMQKVFGESFAGI